MIRGRIFPKGGDDAEHPTFISMYTFIAHQAPSGPTRLKVNPLLFKIYMNIYGTWSLPHHGTLCIIRYEGDRRQAAKELPGGQGEGPKGHKEEGGVHEDQLCTNPVPTGLEDPVCTGYIESWRRGTLCARACTVPTGPPCARAQLTPCTRAHQDGRLSAAVWASSSSTSSPYLYIPYLDHLLGLVKDMIDI